MPRLSLNSREAIRQAIEMQKVLYAGIMDPATKHSDRASMSKAWETLEDRKRILKGKPLPGSLVHPKQNAKKQPKVWPVLVLADESEQADQPDTSGNSDSAENAS